MAKITISETNTAVVSTQTTEVNTVFIPGFSNNKAAGTITYYNSVANFISGEGSTYPTFSTDQAYPAGFDSLAGNITINEAPLVSTVSDSISSITLPYVGGADPKFTITSVGKNIQNIWDNHWLVNSVYIADSTTHEKVDFELTFEFATISNKPQYSHQAYVNQGAVATSVRLSDIDLATYGNSSYEVVIELAPTVSITTDYPISSMEDCTVTLNETTYTVITDSTISLTTGHVLLQVDDDMVNGTLTFFLKDIIDIYTEDPTSSFSVNFTYPYSIMYQAGAYDTGYIQAKALLNKGLPVYYYSMGTTPNIYTVYASETTVGSLLYGYNKLAEEYSDYDIKFITSGGYPVIEYSSNIIGEAMGACAAVSGSPRKIALLDSINSSSRTYTEVYNAISAMSFTYPNYSAVFLPWGTYTESNVISGTTTTKVPMPASFGYLLAYASSIKNNDTFQAIAGVTRGLTSFQPLEGAEILTNTKADMMQPDGTVTTGRSINCITNIRNYGQCIFGNRTLTNIATAADKTPYTYLNLDILVADVEQAAYSAALALLYEQNTEILFINFKARVAPLLDQIKSNSGIADYRILRVETNDRTKLGILIRIVPIYAVEAIDITIEMTDEDSIDNVVISEG